MNDDIATLLEDLLDPVLLSQINDAVTKLPNAAITLVLIQILIELKDIKTRSASK